MGFAVRFTALTAARPGNIADAEWTEFDDAGLWTVSAEKMKMDREHIVPLSRQALAILKQVALLTGERKYVFSCSRDRPISDNTLNKRLRDLGYETGKDHCAHGFRMLGVVFWSAITGVAIYPVLRDAKRLADAAGPSQTHHPATTL